MTALIPDPRGRLVSGLERVWLAAGRISPPYAPGVVVEGDGPLSERTWTAAWQTVLADHPLLAARLVGRGRHLRWAAGGPRPPVDVVDTPWDGRDGQAAPWLTPRMQPNTDPLLRAVLEPRSGRYAVVAHHALLDGRALYHLAERWAAAARGEGLPPAPPGPSEVELAHAAKATPVTDPPADRPAPGATNGSDRQILWARRAAPLPARPLAEVARRLVDHAGVPLRVSIPVDLLPGPQRPLRNLTGIVRVELVPGDGVDAIHQQIQSVVGDGCALGHAVAAEQLAGVPLWLMAWVGGRAARRDLRRGRWVASAVISNLGRVEPVRLSGAGFTARRAFLLPPGHAGVPAFITLAGCPQGLEIAAAGPHATLGGGRLDALLRSLAA